MIYPVHCFTVIYPVGHGGHRKNSWHRSAPPLSVQNACVCMPVSIAASRMYDLECCTEQSAHTALDKHVRAGTFALRLHHSYHTPSVKLDPGFCYSSGVRLFERTPKTALQYQYRCNSVGCSGAMPFCGLAATHSTSRSQRACTLKR